MSHRLRIAAGLARGLSGRLLDLGARDRALARFLPPDLAYVAADASPGLDLCLDLEAPLPLPDRAFEIVAAIDVLEHLEKIHAAFGEVCRVAARRVIVSLPNLATLSARLGFLLRGRFRTGKYDLLPEHQGDRHRWLTVLPETEAFVRVNAARCGFEVVETVLELDGPRWRRAALFLPAHLVPPVLAAERAVWRLERRPC